MSAPHHASRAAPALSIERLAVPFGDRDGLADISLDGAGERVAIVGPSGVGKTTLLRGVAGLAPVAGGRVRVGGADVTGRPPERRDAVYLHQTPVLFAHLTVGENVAFPLRVRGARGGAVATRVAEALAAVRLTGMEARAPHALSGGQRHRVALARAIAARPAALLLDEPLAALDPALRDEVRGAIVAAQAEYGPAMLLVTHDLDDAGLLADRVAVMLGGRIAQLAAPAALFACPASLAVARFLGVFQELPAVARADGGADCALGAVRAAGERAGMPAGAPVAVAFRAESLRVGAPEDGPVRGTVAGARHRARGATLVVRLADGAEVEAALDPRAATRAVGDAVSVALDPCGALLFPREDRR